MYVYVCLCMFMFKKKKIYYYVESLKKKFISDINNRNQFYNETTDHIFLKLLNLCSGRNLVIISNIHK